MKKLLQVGTLAPLCTVLLAASVAAAPEVVPGQQSMAPTQFSVGNATSFDDGVAALRGMISERQSKNVMSAERAARLNAVLYRSVAMRNQYVAQGRKLTPEQINRLKSTLNSVRVAARARMQFQ
jgi:hypothetical protein